MENKLPSDLIDIATAAGFLHVHGATVRRWIGQGRIAAWKVGACWRLSQADVIAMVKPFVPTDGPRPRTTAEIEAEEREVDRVLRKAKVRQ